MCPQLSEEDRRHPRIPFDTVVLAPYLTGRGLREVEWLSGGKVNSSYRLRFDDGHQVVARLYARGSPELDAVALSFAAPLVPVPAIIASGDDWAVMRWLPGQPLSEDRTGVRDAARSLARIASVTFARAGILTADGPEPFEFGDFGNVEELLLDDEEIADRLGPGLVDAVRMLRERERDRFALLDSHTSLIHGDYNPTNILVEDGMVSGILDWEYAMVATPYMDIGNLRRNLGDDADEEMEAGLREGGFALPSDWRRLASLADLSSQLEFLASSRSEAFKQTCIARIRATVGAEGREDGLLQS